ncbi:MAG: hypothetical protein IPK76_15085 [Lewinellaceae bacterium]|nr:hypothetical protein [Lewinellaceae bacterium]
MPVLANTDCTDREQIREAFLPFARPDYVEGMILGNDLDSLLSGMYLHQKFGWPVAGVYCNYSRLWHTEAVGPFLEKLYSGKLIAVDLDIYHAAVPSLGHHIIALNREDALPGHSHSLNPNALRGFSVEHQFFRKYPLSTLHFLLWLFGEPAISRDAELLVWLTDSSFINAQQYRANVEAWVRHFAYPSFTRLLPALQTPEFETLLRDRILSRMAPNALCRPGKPTYASRHLGLSGWQCQFDHPVVQQRDLEHLLALLADICDWKRLPFPETFAGLLDGRRLDIQVSALREIDTPFSEWLEQTGVFSYAFTFKDRLNYTVLR